MESGLVDIFAFIGSSKAADALVKARPWILKCNREMNIYIYICLGVGGFG